MSAHRKEQLTGDPPPPARLIDDPATSSLVRKDLINVAGAAPAYDATAGFAALQAALGAGGSAAAGAGATQAGATQAGAAQAGAAHVAKLGLGIKLAITGGVGVLAVTSAVLFTPAVPRGAPAQPRRAPAVQAPPPVAPIAPVVPAAPLAPKAPSQAQSPPEDAPVSRASRDAAAAEIAQLASIKAAVDRAPARALRLAELGHRRFGEGYLHHEREGLAIIALHALGRRGEAAARAQRYLARYPHNPMSDRVRALAVQGDGR